MAARIRVAAALSLLSFAFAACENDDGGGSGGPVEGVPGSSAVTPAFTGAPKLDPPVTVVASGLRIPWGLAFRPDGTALVTERGNLVPTSDDKQGGVDTSGIPRILSVTPAGRVTEVQQLPEVDRRMGEGGLLGLAVSPAYAADGWVFVYYSADRDNRIARLKLGAAA